MTSHDYDFAYRLRSVLLLVHGVLVSHSDSMAWHDTPWHTSPLYVSMVDAGGAGLSPWAARTALDSCATSCCLEWQSLWHWVLLSSLSPIDYFKLCSVFWIVFLFLDQNIHKFGNVHIMCNVPTNYTCQFEMGTNTEFIMAFLPKIYL